MYFKTRSTSSELKRLMLKGGRCSGQTQRNIRIKHCIHGFLNNILSQKDGIVLQTLTEWQRSSSLQYLKHCSMSLSGVSARNISYKLTENYINYLQCTFDLIVQLHCSDNNVALLTYVNLMDGLDDGQESRSLLFFKVALSAKKHSLDIQLQQDSSSRFRKFDFEHTA